ncbi:unnamed protein product [Thlaspi arvense]|uniref:Ethylene insensitive 3-like DNA-binding domain-containing protein n=1 Tax=Thlaspi arvense TaxID=13288 RepID=A0AAU9ST06_THLAR|nr:unnamed protein product [Thlaspi arvense]
MLTPFFCRVRSFFFTRLQMYNNNNNSTGFFRGLISCPAARFSEADVSTATIRGLCNDLTDQELEIQELEKKIWKDKQRLKRLKEMSKISIERRLLKQPDDDPEEQEQSSRRLMYQAQDGILKYMSKSMEFCNAQGFVYGIVFENGKTVAGSSDNLREWWKEKVRFDRNGPAAIAKYNREMNPSEPLAFSGEDNNASGFRVPGTAPATEVLFSESADYDVDGTVGSHLRLSPHYPEFGNHINGGHNKRRFEGELGMSLHPTVLTCENSLCPHSQPHMGFHDRVLRENHQMNCPYKNPQERATPPYYQPTKVPYGMHPGLVAPHPGYNRSFHGTKPENQAEMQQVQSIHEQFDPSNNLCRPRGAQGGGNNEYLSDHRFGLVDNLSPSTSAMNHNPGLVLPNEYNGNAGTVGMENNLQNQEEDLAMSHWVD